MSSNIRINTTSPLDKVHFNNNTSTTGLDGLRILGNDWKSVLPLTSGSPIIAIPMRNITVTKSGSTFTLTAPSGYSNYYWVANNNRLDNASFTTQSITVTGGPNYRCYLKKSMLDEKIELTASGATSSTCAANRMSAEGEELSDSEAKVNLKGYPNPATNDFTIEFEIPFDANFAKLDLTNMTGDVVKVVAQGSFAKGHFTYPMVGKELPSGTYICRLLINDTTYSTKLIKLGQ